MSGLLSFAQTFSSKCKPIISVKIGEKSRAIRRSRQESAVFSYYLLSQIQFFIVLSLILSLDWKNESVAESIEIYRSRHQYQSRNVYQPAIIIMK